jgi:Methyltransferase FkbM domain
MLNPAKVRFCDFVSQLDPENPFFAIDIGCSGGLIYQCRYMEPRLRGIGFDPNRAEVDRLKAAERNPNVHYECGFVSVPESKALPGAPVRGIFNRNPWGRLAVSRSLQIREQLRATRTIDQLTKENLWTQVELADPEKKIFLPEYLSEQGIRSVDFVKIDVDGDDYAILCSFAPHLENLGVLALYLEVNFFGAGTEDENSLHNIDRLLKRAGFELVDLSVRRYSGAALPAPYVGPYPGGSGIGRIFQGDALYIRDLCADPPEVTTPKAGKVLNLASVLAIFNLPDMAAELVERWPPFFGTPDNQELAKELLLEVLADLESGGKPCGYAEYMKQFGEDGSIFYGKWPHPTKAAENEKSDLASNEVTFGPQVPAMRVLTKLRSLVGKAFK